MTPYIIILTTKVHHSDIVGVYNQMIMEKGMVEFWRNLYSGYFMLSTSYVWSQRKFFFKQ